MYLFWRKKSLRIGNGWKVIGNIKDDIYRLYCKFIKCMLKISKILRVGEKRDKD